VGAQEKSGGGTSKKFRPALCAGIVPPHFQIASDATGQMWTFISRSIPGFDYTRLKPCTYWAEEDTNNNNIGLELAYNWSVYVVSLRYT